MNEDLWQDLAELTLEHLLLVVVAVFIAVSIGLPLGLWIARRTSAQRLLLGVASVTQTIPSLALLGFLLPLPLIGGIGKRTAVVALVLYALLPILRNTVVGLQGVDPAVREAALAMGLTPREMLRLVDLPLAARTILAGIRTATVATIGTATIAAIIGGGGLGVFLFRGMSAVDTTQILAGAIPAALMALVADALLGWLERRVAA